MYIPKYLSYEISCIWNVIFFVWPSIDDLNEIYQNFKRRNVYFKDDDWWEYVFEDFMKREMRT